MPGSEVDEIKARLDLVDVISPYVQLKRSGRTFKGLCPFHSEKTPSFIVFPETGTWHCFGCHEGGDLFTFVMKREDLEFPEALRRLAERAGVTLAPRRSDDRSSDERERLYRALEAAALLYHALLKGPSGVEAREYLARRGIDAATTDAFLLGYYPDAPGTLLRHLGEQGFSADELEQAGLVGRAEGGSLYERLRGRLIFPIRDARGRTIAFGGRALQEGVQPKYLNTPQTPIFDKGSTLFGLDRARDAIRAAGSVVIVEGYVDVVIAHQHGFRNVVATLGTAITERHLAQVKRLAREVVLALDPDAAGQAAMLRGLDVARSALADDEAPVLDPRGVLRFQSTGQQQVKVMVLPPGKDPDDLIRSDPDGWRALAARAEPVVDFVLERLGERFDLSTPRGRSAAAREAGVVLAEVADPVERATYVQRAAQRIGISEAILSESIRLRLKRPSAARQEPSQAARSRGDELEFYALALLLRLGSAALPDEATLLTAEGRGLLRRLRGVIAAGGEGLDAEIVRLRDDPSLAEAAERLLSHYRAAERLSDEVLSTEWESVRLELRDRRLAQEHRQLRALLDAGEESPGDGDSTYWARRLNEIAQERRRIEAARLAPGRRLAPVAWRLRDG